MTHRERVSVGVLIFGTAVEANAILSETGKGIVGDLLYASADRQTLERGAAGPQHTAGQRFDAADADLTQAGAADEGAMIIAVRAQIRHAVRNIQRLQGAAVPESIESDRLHVVEVQRFQRRAAGKRVLRDAGEALREAERAQTAAGEGAGAHALVAGAHLHAAQLRAAGEHAAADPPVLQGGQLHVLQIRAAGEHGIRGRGAELLGVFGEEVHAFQAGAVLKCAGLDVDHREHRVAQAPAGHGRKLRRHDQVHRVVLQPGDDDAVYAAGDLLPLVADVIFRNQQMGIGFGVEEAVAAHVGEGADIEGLLDPAGLRGAAVAPVRGQLQIVGHDVGAEAPQIAVRGPPAAEDFARFRRIVRPDRKAAQRDALVRYGAAAVAVKVHQSHVFPDRVDGVALFRRKGRGAVLRTLEGLADPGGRRRRVRGAPGPAAEFAGQPVVLNDCQIEQVFFAQIRVVGV